MSVKRYLAKISWTQIETEEHPAGEFVRWSDYAALQAEVERLRKELADAQENYHIVNEMVAKMLKEGKQS